MKVGKVFLLSLIFLLVARQAYAYLDPGTGSMIIQAIVAALVTVGVFWRSLLSFFKSFLKKEKDTSERQ